MNDDGAGSWAWVNQTGGYGQIYHHHLCDPIAPLFGGLWNDSAYCGSRYIALGCYLWTASTIGARFASDSL